jgi:hypothetical protein
MVLISLGFIELPFDLVDSCNALDASVGGKVRADQDARATLSAELDDDLGVAGGVAGDEQFEAAATFDGERDNACGKWTAVGDGHQVA